MAIDVQPPNYSGLVALAGKSAPLNLQPTGALGLQALQQAQANEAALRQSSLQQAQLQQAGQLGLLTNQTQQQQNAQQAQYQQGLLQNSTQQNAGAAAQAAATLQQNALKNQGTQSLETAKYLQTGQNQQATQANAQQKNMLDAHKQVMDQLNKDSEKVLKEKGAHAAYTIMALRDAKTSEAGNLIRTESLKEAVTKGYVSKEDSERLAKMPLSQFGLAVGSMLISTGTAADNKALNPPTAAPGTTTVFDPITGKPVYTSIPTTKAVDTQAQKDVMAAKDSSREITNLYKNVGEESFGYGAFKNNLTYARELASTVPGLDSVAPSVESKAALKKYSDNLAASNGLAMDIIKQKSGVQYSDSQLAFMMNIVPEIGVFASRTVFEGRVANLQRYTNAVIRDREELLKNHLVIGTPEYEAAMSKKTDELQAHFFDDSPKDSPEYKHLAGLKNPDGSPTLTEQDILAAIAKGKK